MKTTKIALIALLAPALVGGIASTACSDVAKAAGPLGDLAAQCGLVCDEQALVKGNAQISGTASIDLFFASVVDFNAKASLVSSNIEAQLTRIRGAVGATTNAEIKAKLQAKLAANVEGKATFVVVPPKCEVSASASIDAAAKCDAMVTPGMVSAKCTGTCSADVSATAMCDASATVTCSGTAPSLVCMGTCNAECTGTCTLSGTAKCDGKCSAELGADGSCNGTCTLNAGAKCGGSCSAGCKGECNYTPPDAKCTGGAEVKCQAKANASIDCKGKCEGSVTPPMVKAECDASVKASAELNVECKPAKADISFTAKAGVTADATAEFEASMAIFVDAYGQILAEVKRADVVVKVGANLVAAAPKAISEAATSLTAKADLKATLGGACALKAVTQVPGLIATGTGKLTSSVAVAADITSAI